MALTAGGCYASEQRLADLIGCHRNTIGKYRKKLIDLGWFTVVSRNGGCYRRGLVLDIALPVKRRGSALRGAFGHVWSSHAADEGADESAAAGYGLPAAPEPGSAGPYLAVKGVRDITSGLFVFIPIAARDPRVLGWLTVAATLTLIGDPVIVIRHHGSKATACAVHGATAAFMRATAGLLLAVPP